VKAGTLSESEAAQRLEQLAKLIAHHDQLYHAEDSPQISDAEYDALVRENRELEARFPHLVRADSPSQRLGAAPTGALAKVRHARPMLSLENAFSEDEVAEFAARVRRFFEVFNLERGLVAGLAITVLVGLVQQIFRPTRRELIIALFTGFFVAYFVLSIFGTSFRGEGQNLTWPWDLPLVHE